MDVATHDWHFVPMKYRTGQQEGAQYILEPGGGYLWVGKRTGQRKVGEKGDKRKTDRKRL